MRRVIIFILTAILLSQVNVAQAQKRKRSNKRKAKTEKVVKSKNKPSTRSQQSRDDQKPADAINRHQSNQQSQQQEQQSSYTSVTTSSSEKPKFDDPLIKKYVISGYTVNDKVYLNANENYAQISESEKRQLISKFMELYYGYDVVVIAATGEEELWTTANGAPSQVEQWNATNLDLQNYSPLELQTTGDSRVFFSAGAMLNYSSDMFSSSITLQGGTYLYKNFIDLSLSLNVGINKAKESKSQFTGDVGLSTRVYPYRFKKLMLAPYVGGGVGFIFAPDTSFEPRVLAGVCWYVGPGSLDFGGQWGTKSDWSITIGYTFRPSFGIKKKQ